MRVVTLWGYGELINLTLPYLSVFEILKATWPVGPILIEHKYHWINQECGIGCPPNGHPGPNLTKVGTSPLLEWGRPTSPLQWTNGDGSRWRLSAGGPTCRRTAAASVCMGQGGYEGAVAMRALSFKSRTQQMRSHVECIACIVTAPLFSPGCCCCSTRSVQLQWRHLKGGANWHAPPMMSPLHCDSVEFQSLLKIEIATTQEKHSLTIFNDVAWTRI